MSGIKHGKPAAKNRKAGKVTITVDQYHNVRFNPQQEPSDSNSEYVYRVTKLQNTLVPAIGDLLGPAHVRRLIADGATVNIQGTK